MNPERCHAAGAEATLREAASLEAAGDFRGAEALLLRARRTALAGDEAARRILEFEHARLERIRRDYRLTRSELFEAILATVSQVTAEEFEGWIAEGRFDRQRIDGTERFFGSSVANLLFRFPELESRRIKPKNTSALQEAYWRNAEDIRAAARSEGRTYVLPKRFRVRMHVELAKGAVRGGERVAAWLPVPRRYPFQDEFRLIRTSSPVVSLESEASPIRSVYLEQRASGDLGPRFEIEYEYATRGVWFDLDPGRWQPLDSAAESLRPWLGEAPHVRWTPVMRELAARIGGGDTNGVRLARRYYDWLADGFRYSYAPEYSTIRDLAETCRAEGRGDCGQLALVFMTLCRIGGIPARWQSGWAIFPGDETIHDWCEVFLPPWGWVPVDPYMGLYATRYATGLTSEKRAQLRDFYFGGLTQFRMAANSDHNQDLRPTKLSIRSDPVDFQRGEVEVEGRNLYFDKFDYGLTWEEMGTVPGP